MKSYLINANRLKQITVVCSLVLFSQVVHAKSKQYEVVELCSMSQNVLKDKLLISMDITYSNPEKNLIAVKKKIDTKLLQLKKEKLSKKLHKKIIALKSSWATIKKKTEKKVTQEKALNLYTRFNSFDTQCQSLAKGVTSSKSKKKLLFTKLNLNVQSMTTLYVVKSWDLMDTNLYSKKIAKMISSYQDIRTSLDAVAKKSDLEKLDKEFTALKFMVSSSSGRYMPVLANKKASAINDIITQILEGK